MLARNLTARSSAGSVATLVGIDAPRLDTPRLLVLCTANQCRSPMAEVLLRHRLADVGIHAEVASAGILEGGVAASRPAVDVLAARGIDLASHESRRMDAAEVAAADLVLGMERRHVQEAVVLVPDVESRAFTLKDLVKRAEVDQVRQPDESLREWAARLAATRDRSELLGVGDDAVDDPIGRSKSHYERTVVELDDLLTRLVARAFPEAAVTSAPGGHETTAASVEKVP